MDRTKGLRQKINGQYSTFVPFGTDGELVDMISDLNLEHELKIGPKHVANITAVTEDITDIVEFYATPQESRTPGTSFYTVKTRVDSTTWDPQDTDIPDEPIPIPGPGQEIIISNKIDARLYQTRVNDTDPISMTDVFLKRKHTEIWTTTTNADEETPSISYSIKEVYSQQEVD